MAVEDYSAFALSRACAIGYVGCQAVAGSGGGVGYRGGDLFRKCLPAGVEDGAVEATEGATRPHAHHAPAAAPGQGLLERLHLPSAGARRSPGPPHSCEPGPTRRRGVEPSPAAAPSFRRRCTAHDDTPVLGNHVVQRCVGPLFGSTQRYLHKIFRASTSHTTGKARS
jgi:hypothetical protein